MRKKWGLTLMRWNWYVFTTWAIWGYKVLSRNEWGICTPPQSESSMAFLTERCVSCGFLWKLARVQQHQVRDLKKVNVGGMRKAKWWLFNGRHGYYLEETSLVSDPMPGWVSIESSLWGQLVESIGQINIKGVCPGRIQPSGTQATRWWAFLRLGNEHLVHTSNIQKGWK